jgi:hypothetical protein
MNRSVRPIFEDPIKLIVILCLLLAAAAGSLALVQRHALIAELEQESVTLYRLASQRAPTVPFPRPLNITVAFLI